MKWICQNCKAINPQFGYDCHNCGKARMTEKQAAEYLQISPYYLRNLRHLLHEHNGPAFTMVPRPDWRGGVMAIYEQEELDRWKSQHKWRKKRAA